MKPFTQLTAVAAPLDRINVDTDQIIPKQFLKSIARTGFGKSLFSEWRYLDGDGTEPNPDFVLNKRPYATAGILLTRENFGCGSSREHASWALMDFGIRCVVSSSFADIFYSNALKNGLLPAIISAGDLDALFAEVEAHEGTQLTVDLNTQLVTSPAGLEIPFEIATPARHNLLNGLDEIGLTMQHEAEITQYEATKKTQTPWLFS